MYLLNTLNPIGFNYDSKFKKIEFNVITFRTLHCKVYKQ